MTDKHYDPPEQFLPAYAEVEYMKAITHALEMRTLAHKQATCLLKAPPKDPSGSGSEAVAWRASLSETVTDLRDLRERWESMVPPDGFARCHILIHDCLMHSESSQRLLNEGVIEGDKTKFAEGTMERMRASDLSNEAMSEFRFITEGPRILRSDP